MCTNAVVTCRPYILIDPLKDVKRSNSNFNQIKMNLVFTKSFSIGLTCIQFVWSEKSKELSQIHVSIFLKY